MSKAAFVLALALAALPPAPAREVAVTFDDLPVAGTIDFTVADWTRITHELISALQRNRIPAIGFVNEAKLYRAGTLEPARVALLRQWLDAGLELGNHTYSHPDLHTTPVETFEREVLRGEEVTRKLLAERRLTPRFFRHPFLHTGRSLDVRTSLERFLKERGYRVTPVTIDNYDYIFANAFDRARDEAGRKAIASAYVDYMTDVVAYYERQSAAIVGHEVRQVLLLHASALNASTLDALGVMLKGRGYTFVSLDHALEDSAYASSDTYVGPSGITWLHRWALTQGKRGSFFAGEPVVPGWIEEASKRPTGGSGIQRPALSDAVKAYVKVDAVQIALTNARVIDGTGAPARERQTILIADGNIADVGDATRVAVPAGATTIDLGGKTVMPGLVMVHEHLYYPTAPGVYGQLGESFTRLYLAGGVTTMRTGGNLNGFMDLNLKRAIESGAKPGPAIDATAPYVNGPNTFIQMHAVANADEARRHVAYWNDVGATSVKAYMGISRAALGAAIDEAHKRGIKVTGHLCSVTYGEAADLGIDNLEHGFLAATDFVPDKQPDVCPGQGRGQQTIAALDEHGAPFQTLVKKLVDKRVALTSTLTVFETLTPGRPMPPGLEVLTPQLKERFEQTYARVSQSNESLYTKLFPKAMALERAFARAGGLLIAGTDPTGAGGVIPGFSNQRQIELLVDAGFTPLQAITIGTLNGARYLGRESRIGTIARGKQADLVVLNGDPSANIADIRKVDTVFRQGIGFDPAKLIDSVRGQAGLW